MVIKDGVDFDSLDGEPVHLLFLIAAHGYRRQYSPGSAQQAVCDVDG